jgi:hypothetical protein
MQGQKVNKYWANLDTRCGLGKPPRRQQRTVHIQEMPNRRALAACLAANSRDKFGAIFFAVLM